MQFCWKNHVSFCLNIMDGPLANLWRGGGVGGLGWKLIYSCKGKDTGEVREIRMKKKKNSCSSNFLHPAITFLMV